MRVMVIVKASADSENGGSGSPEAWEEMGKFNEQLAKAGILIQPGEGLKPSKAGKRIHFDGPQRMVTDGPFTETKELIAGFWLWKVKDLDEAVEWVKKCPNPMSGPSDIEIRPLFEMEDFVDVLGTEGVEEKNAKRAKIGSN